MCLSIPIYSNIYFFALTNIQIFEYLSLKTLLYSNIRNAVLGDEWPQLNEKVLIFETTITLEFTL